jgi:hypothetical protein
MVEGKKKVKKGGGKENENYSPSSHGRHFLFVIMKEIRICCV